MSGVITLYTKISIYGTFVKYSGTIDTERARNMDYIVRSITKLNFPIAEGFEIKITCGIFGSITCYTNPLKYRSKLD